MTYNPLDSDVAKFQSGTFPMGGSLHHTAPDWVSTSSSGGGGTSFGADGGQVISGGASSDHGAIIGPRAKGNPTDWGGHDKAVIELWFSINKNAAPVNDKCLMGLVPETPASRSLNGAGIDLTAEQFFTGGGTVALNSGIVDKTTPSMTYVRIELDNLDGNTIFYAANGNGSQTETLSGTIGGSNVQAIASIEGANGELALIQAWRVAWYPR